ncbi:MAG: adaptor protein MecA [Lachnospiraceae bacterium]|nr:adaptor protein MecA [Lachnospiraceae bacterium]
MKIEKLNDSQIRCTLTKEDLASRQIKVSELAYGSDKARGLFRDMMEQASEEFGFEVNESPLMIEAVPLNRECLVLIITKVNDPEELDTRFSRFTPDPFENEDDDDEDADKEILDLFKQTQSVAKAPEIVTETIENAPEKGEEKRIRSFYFNSVSDIIGAAEVCGEGFNGDDSLYLDNINGKYILVVSEGDDPRSFLAACNTLTEYAASNGIKGEPFISERHKLLIKGNALKKLSNRE